MEVLPYARTNAITSKNQGFASRMKTKLRRVATSRSNLKDLGAEVPADRPFADLGNRRVEEPAKDRQQKSLKLTKSRPILKESQCDLSQLCSKIEVLMQPKIPAGVTDIDEAERDYLQEPVYAQDVMKYLRTLEKKFVIPRNYLDGKDVNHNMRSMLVDWLIQVQDHLKLEQETLHLTIAFVDHFLHRRSVSVGKLQLIGVVCLLIASKYIERFAPEIDELVRLTDSAYSFKQVIRMELVVLKVLRFELYMPEQTVFLNRYLKVVGNDEKTTMICRYLLDLSLSDPTCVTFPASLKAAATINVARHLVAMERNTDPAWTRSLAYYTGYEHKELLPVMKHYVKLLLRVPTAKQQGARTKYSSRSRFQCVAKWHFVEAPEVLNRLLESL